MVDGVTAASLTDAMGRRHAHKCHILDLVSPLAEPMFGQAVTIQYLPTRADTPSPSFSQLFYEAIGENGEGKVLVMAGAHPDTSIGGGTKLSRVANHHMAGTVTDGRLRDWQELQDWGKPAYCAGETVRWGGDVIEPAAANVPLNLCGVTIHPGDWVYADAAAVVVIPDADKEWVIAEARHIEAADAKAIATIRTENPEAIRNEGSNEA